jgi:hypothetical protein
MKANTARLRYVVISAIFLSAIAAAPLSQAATITWTNWTAGTAGNPGSASGAIALSPSVSVTYNGQTAGRTLNYPSWTPAGTFSGGAVGNAPPQSFNAVALTGGSAATNTITFSTAITDPVFAIWSLGSPSIPASFNFTASEPFTVQAGGGSVEYGGSSITKSGNNVLGAEGDGVIQFSGTFTQITWTNPVFESYYAFTVGIAGVPSSAVPEPAGLAISCIGLAALAFLRRSKHGA